MITFPIDFIFPYVDNTQDQWRKTFKEFCITTNRENRLDTIDNERYDNFNLLKYLLRSIDKFMPWVNNLFIIVQDKTQVPDWVNKDSIQIIEHKDFIPEQFLPTYNSTTIEMFLGKIPNLSDHFIYSNDDLFITQPLQPEDFFTDDGKPKIKLIKQEIKPLFNQFYQVSLRSYRDVASALGAYYNTYDFMRPEHSMAPLCLSHVRKIFSLLQGKIFSSISNFRTNNNYNQYIYTNYAYLTNKYRVSNIKFKHLNMRDNIDEVINTIKSKNYQQICLNDTPKTDRKLLHENINRIEEAFESIGLDVKSKYEV